MISSSGSLFSGLIVQPSSLSVRCLAGTWILCCVILYAAYSANLIAFLTIKKTKMPFDTLLGMVQHPHYSYGMEKTNFVIERLLQVMLDNVSVYGNVS